jgi:hypothetical protein
MATIEKSASEVLAKLLNSYWSADSVKKPTILATTNVNYAKVDATRGDFIIIKITPTGEDDRPMGNYTYRNQITPLSAEIRTKESSQRMHDIKYELRRVCFVHKHDVEVYQLVSYLGFTEEVESTQNFWRGTCKLELSRVGVYALD